MPNEFEIIEWIRSKVTSGNSGYVKLGIGDDCSVINQPDDTRKWLITTDMLLDGRHFQLQTGLHSPEQVGRKAMGVNISDIAAMAGTPLAAFVSVALPKSNTKAIAQLLTEGIKAEAEKFDIVLAGGDTNVWDGPLVINITLIGLEPVGGAVLRSGARPGDHIFVSGPLGGSFPSGRHMKPNPQIKLAQDLKSRLGEKLHAMIDISDGLAGDLRHILKESNGLGANLIASRIPIHPDVRSDFSDNSIEINDDIAMEHALCDGEDFELCLCVEPDSVAQLPEGLFHIGQICTEPGIRLIGSNGVVKTWTRGGFDHFGRN